MQDELNNRERVSALVDGQLQGDEFDQAVRWAARNPEGQSTWHAYHLVGEALRASEALNAGLSAGREADFMAKFRRQLQQEPVLQRPVDGIKSIAGDAMNTPAGGQKGLKLEAANDASYRWKRVAGLASVVAVLAVGFLASGLWDAQRGAPQLARATPDATPPGLSAAGPAGVPQVMIRDSELDALLAAHRQFGGTTALQVPTGFMRNATFEGGDR